MKLSETLVIGTGWIAKLTALFILASGAGASTVEFGQVSFRTNALQTGKYEAFAVRDAGTGTCGTSQSAACSPTGATFETGTYSGNLKPDLRCFGRAPLVGWSPIGAPEQYRWNPGELGLRYQRVSQRPCPIAWKSSRPPVPEVHEQKAADHASGPATGRLDWCSRSPCGESLRHARQTIWRFNDRGERGLFCCCTPRSPEIWLLAIPPRRLDPMHPTICSRTNRSSWSSQTACGTSHFPLPRSTHASAGEPAPPAAAATAGLQEIMSQPDRSRHRRVRLKSRSQIHRNRGRAAGPPPGYRAQV